MGRAGAGGGWWGGGAGGWVGGCGGGVGGGGGGVGGGGGGVGSENSGSCFYCGGPKIVKHWGPPVVHGNSLIDRRIMVPSKNSQRAQYSFIQEGT